MAQKAASDDDARDQQPPPTRWTSQLSLVYILEGKVAEFAPHKISKIIASGKLTFDERTVVQRVVPAGCPRYLGGGESRQEHLGHVHP